MSTTLTVFPAPGESGRSLAVSVRDLGNALGYQVNIPVAPTWKDYHRACLCDRAVIVDASIEDGRDDIYRIASVSPTIHEHVLIVSRTYLPLNFKPRVAGGSPPYPYPHIEALEEQGLLGTPGGSWGNREIVAWLETKLARIKNDPPTHRLRPEEVVVHLEGLSPEEFHNGPGPVSAQGLASYKKMMGEAHQRWLAEQVAPEIFISYRSRYQRNERSRSLLGGSRQGSSTGARGSW